MARPEEKLFQRQARDLTPQQRRTLEILRERHPELVRDLVEKSVREGRPQVNVQDPVLRRAVRAVEEQQKDPDSKGPKLSPPDRRVVEDFIKQGEHPPKQTPRENPADRTEPTPPDKPPAGLPEDMSRPRTERNTPADQIEPDPGSPKAEEPEFRAETRRKLLEAVDKLDDLSGPLGKSPAWHEMLDGVSQHLLEGIDSGTGGNGSDLENKVTFLGRYAHEVDRWSQPGRAAVQRMHLDAAVREQVPRGGPTRGWAPFVSVPRVGASSLPGTEAFMALLWIGMIGLAVALLWQVFRRKQGEAQRAAALRRLGPWPVPPQQVTTREQLIRAFEHLSLLCLGPAAQSQNHLEIAAALGGDDAERRRAAAALAAVYEQARYAPADEPLADETAAAARRDLCFLAGVAAI
jgi:hypothetical protein